MSAEKVRKEENMEKLEAAVKAASHEQIAEAIRRACCPSDFNMPDNINLCYTDDGCTKCWREQVKTKEPGK